MVGLFQRIGQAFPTPRLSRKMGRQFWRNWCILRLYKKVDVSIYTGLLEDTYCRAPCLGRVSSNKMEPVFVCAVVCTWTCWGRLYGV